MEDIMAKVVGGLVVDPDITDEVHDIKEPKGNYCAKCLFDWGQNDTRCPRCGCKKYEKHDADGPVMKTKTPEPLIHFSL